MKILTLDEDFAVPETDLILEKGDGVLVFTEAERHTLDQGTRGRAGRELQQFLKQTYFDDIPIREIGEILKRHGIVLLMEDNREWAGFLMGSNSEADFMLGDFSTGQIVDWGTIYTPYTNVMFRMTWYKMQSGKWEIIGYLS